MQVTLRRYCLLYFILKSESLANLRMLFIASHLLPSSCVTVTHSHVTPPWIRADCLELGWEPGAGFAPSAHLDTWLLVGIPESLS